MSEMKTALDRMRERAEEAERKLEEARSHEYLLGWRSLDADDGCKSCGGSGVRAYSTTATWRGGAGGATITNDVCHDCWGSGSRTNKWPSHRSFDRMRERAEQAERKLKQTCAEKVRRENELCAQIGGLHEASERIARERDEALRLLESVSTEESAERERAERAERELEELKRAVESENSDANRWEPMPEYGDYIPPPSDGARYLIKVTRERDESRAQLAKWLKWAEDEGRPALVKLTALEKHERSADQ